MILCKEKIILVEAGSKSFNEQMQVTSVSVKIKEVRFQQLNKISRKNAF